MDVASKYEYSTLETAVVLVDCLDKGLVEYFNQHIDDNSIELQKYLQNEMAYPAMGTEIPLLEKVVMHLLDTEIKENTEEEALRKYKSLVKNRKDYFFKTIREECGLLPSKPGNSKFIEKEHFAIHSPFIVDRSVAALSSLSYEELKKKRFDEIQKWHDDPNGKLYQFPYFSSLPVKRRVNCLVQDIGLAVFNTICMDFYRRSDGFVTRAMNLTLGSNSRIVNWQNSFPELEYELANDQLLVYEILDRNSSGTETRLIMDSIPLKLDKTDPLYDSKLQKAISQVDKEYQEGVRVQTFVPFDWSIYTAILNNMNIRSVNSGELHIRLFDLMRDVYGYDDSLSTKFKRHAVDLMEHLHKLSKMKIQNYVKNSNNKLIGGGVISFFDYNFLVADELDVDGNQMYISTDDIISPDFNGFTAKDYKKMELVIKPSVFTTRQWESGVHDKIASKLYRSVESPRGKIILQLLQQERMRIYPSLDGSITISELKTNIRFSSTSASRIKKEIEKELDAIKELQTVISNYRIINGEIFIEFIEPSDVERIAYHLPVN